MLSLPKLTSSKLSLFSGNFVTFIVNGEQPNHYRSNKLNKGYDCYINHHKIKKPEIKNITDRIIFAISFNGMGIALSSFVAKEIMNEFNI